MLRTNPRAVIATAAIVCVFLIFQFCSWRPTPRFLPGSLDWSIIRKDHPPPAIKDLPTGDARIIPDIQAPLSEFKNPEQPDPRRDAVLKVFTRSWNAYKQKAWMKDELAPISGGSKDHMGGWGATLVDTLDSLWIMDLKDDFYEAAAAASKIDYTNTSAPAVNLFETTIRHMGGLMGAYDLSGEEALLHKAVELGDMLLTAFDTPNHLPPFWFNFVDADTGDQVAGNDDPSASPGALCLEFTRLSQLTGDAKYYDATDRVTRFLERIQASTNLPGMWPVKLDFKTEAADGHKFSIGAQADTLYEDLPKMHLLLGGLDITYENMYRSASAVIRDNLLFRPMLPNNHNILFAGEYIVHPWGGELVPESQHLACFSGGMFGLGGKLFDIADHMDIADRLARGCGWAYEQFPSGVMPEIFGLIPCNSNDECNWDEDRWQRQGEKSLGRGWLHARDPRYLLRPEAIESIFYLYRLTGVEEYREIAWEMFEGIIWSTETEFANGAIEDVRAKGRTTKLDTMETFWLSQTLKYFYLIFSPPTEISLDEYVLSTQAHPFRLPHRIPSGMTPQHLVPNP